jgi:hypothetical protein
VNKYKKAVKDPFVDHHPVYRRHVLPTTTTSPSIHAFHYFSLLYCYYSSLTVAQHDYITYLSKTVYQIFLKRHSKLDCLKKFSKLVNKYSTLKVYIFHKYTFKIVKKMPRIKNGLQKLKYCKLL